MSLPAHLASNRAQGIRPNEAVAQWEIGTASNFVYAILDWTTREAAVIDSHQGILQVLEELRAHGFRLQSLLLTHTHWDHIGGLADVLAANPDTRLVVHADDQHRLKAPLRSYAGLHLAHDGEELRLGELSIQALHTPGHSAGELCYYLREPAPGYLFTGDTIFIRDCGRTDLETGNAAQLFESIQRIKKLPGGTVILPGHHYTAECASTLQKEMRESPPFLCATLAEFEALP